MKLLFILVTCFAGITLHAQKNPLSTKPQHQVTLAPVKIYPSANDSMVAKMKKRLQYSSESSGIIRLSQDRMPCIIPNQNRTINMPNAWVDGTIGLRLMNSRIPNGSRFKKEPGLQYN